MDVNLTNKVVVLTLHKSITTDSEVCKVSLWEIRRIKTKIENEQTIETEDLFLISIFCIYLFF